MLITVNNTELYYEVTGEGTPIILLHGNGEDHNIFDVLISQLSDKFRVYAIDSRGHGKSENSDNLDYHLMADDIVEFIHKNHIEKPVLYGFSDGGIIGLMISYKFPALLSKLVISGANSSPSGLKFKWRFLIWIAYIFKRDPKLKMMLNEPNITKDDLQKIEIPTLVTAGENDMVKESDTRFIAGNISNSKLVIIPYETHDSYVVNSPKLFDVIKDFIRCD